MSLNQSCFSQAVSALKTSKANTAITMVLALFLTACPSLPYQDESKAIVSTLAGSGEQGFRDGQGRNASFRFPTGIAADAAGNLYVADKWGNRIRRITKEGEVTTLAGSGRAGLTDGLGTSARFYYPQGIAVDAAGNLYVTEEENHCIRKITKKGEVSILAGGGDFRERSGFNDSGEIVTFAQGKKGFADGQGRNALFNRPSGITIDAAGNLYVADSQNHRIRRITPKGEVSTLAGGEKGFADGQGRNARFFFPSGIAMDAAGNLYVTDYENHSIRKVTSKGEVTTIAGGKQGFADGEGSVARFYRPQGIAMSRAGNLYIVDGWNNRIRKITKKGEVTTLAGGNLGFADGEGSAAQFKFAYGNGIAMDKAGNLYVADSQNHNIRKIAVKRP